MGRSLRDHDSHFKLEKPVLTITIDINVLCPAIDTNVLCPAMSNIVYFRKLLIRRKNYKKRFPEITMFKVINLDILNFLLETV